MKKLRLLPLFLFIGFSIFAQSIPRLSKVPRLVNDFGDVLSPTEEQHLEDKLRSYNDSTSTQIVVVILGEELKDDPNLFAAELGEKWHVGQKEADNGLVFLVAPKGKNRQVAIQNGYGLEPFLTDAKTKLLIEDYVIPEFKKDNYYKGIDEGTTQIMKLLAGKFEGKPHKSSRKGFPWIAIVLIAILFIFGFRNRGRGGRGGYRGGGGYWIGGFGGGMGGSGGGFGGGGGGGFGGFGGGSFGGGGASGSW